MRSMAYRSLGSAVLFVSAMGCGVYDEPTGDDQQVASSPGFAAGDKGGVNADEGEEDVGTAEQALVTSRADRVSTITVSKGSWGDWKPTAYCNNDTWAVGYTVRDEGVNKPLVDDTGLNSVRLHCEATNGSFENPVVSYNGLWGLWLLNPPHCSDDDFLKGARLNIQPFQGVNKDDAGAVAAQFRCTDDQTLSTMGTPIGSWSDYAMCPDGSAVCGLSIRFEPSNGAEGDDTAMNGLKLECCKLPGCSHDTCTEGADLDASCGTCVATICEQDPFCCTTSWDARCVWEAGALCGQPCGGGSPIAREGGSCGGFTLGPPPVCADGLYCHYAMNKECGWADTPGTCAVQPETCPEEDSPVCGCDGATYGNACQAAASGISIHYEGACECVHDLCSRGEALDALCDPCVAQVCAVDSFCCENSWDPRCVEEAGTLCGQSCD